MPSRAERRGLAWLALSLLIWGGVERWRAGLPDAPLPIGPTQLLAALDRWPGPDWTAETPTGPIEVDALDSAGWVGLGLSPRQPQLRCVTGRRVEDSRIWKRWFACGFCPKGGCSDMAIDWSFRRPAKAGFPCGTPNATARFAAAPAFYPAPSSVQSRPQPGGQLGAALGERGGPLGRSPHPLGTPEVGWGIPGGAPSLGLALGQLGHSADAPI